jgi:ATP synthase protein I
VPYHRPIPEKKQQPQTAGLFGAWIQAEKMIQIALVLPCAAFIGWVAGIGLDHLFHQKWISMAGIVFGIISGLVGVIQMAVAYTAKPEPGNQNGNGTKKGNSGTSS